MHTAYVFRRQYRGECLSERHLPPSRKRLRKDRWFERATYRRQRIVDLRTHRPDQHITDTAADLFSQPKEVCRAWIVLLQRCQASGCPEAFSQFGPNPTRVGMITQRLRQPLCCLV